MARFKKFHRLQSYYRDAIELDTAHDARHMLSVFTTFFPDISCDFHENDVVLRNITNSFGQPITILWRLKV